MSYPSLPGVLGGGSLSAECNATKLQGRAVASTAPAAGEVLGWNGSQWVPVLGPAPGAHAATHAPAAGSDPLATAAAIELTDATNAEGTGNTLARADHTHAHGTRGGGTLHSTVVSGGSAGFMSGVDKAVLDILAELHADANGVPNGFVDRTESTWSFTDGTRTFAIQPTGASFDIYSDGVKFTKTTPESVVITDTEGTWLIYYDGAGVLSATQSFTSALILEYVIVTVIYWDATNKTAIMANEERHGMIMAPATHLYLHTVIGAAWTSGLALGNLTVDGGGGSNSHAQFSVNNGTFADEDLAHSVTDDTPQNLSPIAYIPILYRLGASGVWRKKTADVFPLIYTGAPPAYVGTRIAYNQYTGGAWQLTEVPNNNYFVLMHFFATPNRTEPIVGILGQSVHATISAARAAAPVELNSLLWGGLPVPEFCPIASVLFQTNSGYANTPNAQIRSVDTGVDYIDWRGAVGGAGGISADVLPHAATHAAATGSDALSTAAANTITAGATPSVGTAETFSRSDHVHGVSTAAPVATGSSNSEGTGSALARSDHVHAWGGSGESYVEANSRTTTTDTDPTWTTKVTLTTGAWSGTYRLDWTVSVDSAAKDVQVRLYNHTDSTEIAVYRVQPATADLRVPVSGFNFVTLAGVAKTFYLQLTNPVGAAETLGAENAHVSIAKVS